MLRQCLFFADPRNRGPAARSCQGACGPNPTDQKNPTRWLPAWCSLCADAVALAAEATPLGKGLDAID